MSTLYRSLIVDDEEHARINLGKMLRSFTNHINLIGEATDGEDALDKIRELSPDLVFFDIHLPKLNAFEIIARLEKPLPKIIFTTVSDKYAAKAFDVNALDYLIKPIRPERLAHAIAKLSVHKNTAPSDEPLILRAMEEMRKVKSKRLQVKTGGCLSFVNISDVWYFQGEDYFSAVHTIDKKYLIDIPLYELETQLHEAEFARIHRSTIVNISCVSKLRRTINGAWQMSMKPPMGKELKVSRSYAKRLREIFQCL